MNPATLAHLTRAATTDAHLVSIAPADLRELLGWYRAGGEAMRNQITDALDDPGATPNGRSCEYEEGWGDREAAALRAIAALPVPEAPNG